MILTREEFAHLHQALLDKYVDKFGAIEPSRTIPSIYGYNEYTADDDDDDYADDDTISDMVYKSLIKSNYIFSQFASKGNTKNRGFQGQSLSRARASYQKNQQKITDLSEKYVTAYLTFLNLKNTQELLIKYPLDTLPEKLLPDTNQLGRKIIMPSQSIATPLIQIEQSLLETACESLNNSTWHFYSWNIKGKKIIRANIYIQQIQSNGIAEVTLKNPPGRWYKPYIGQLDLKHGHKNYLLFDLSTPHNTKFINLTMQYDFECRSAVQICVGVMTKSSDNQQLAYSDVLMERSSESNGLKPKVFSKTDLRLDSRIRNYFEQDTFVYKEVRRYVSSLDDL